MKNYQNFALFSLLIALTVSCEMVDTELDPERSTRPEDQKEIAINFRSESYGWNDHRPPYDFLFGNHFDTHQQTKKSGSQRLNGFFYITAKGDKNGIPVADHGNCDENPEGCTVGWTLHGIEMEAELLQKGMGHPQWYISSEKMPKQRGYTHFHWVKKKDHNEGNEGHQSSAGNSDDSSDTHSSGLEVGATYEGYLLKLTASETFYFEHHGSFLVTPGIDFETHANVYTTK